jgi:hypothetical protein
VPETPVDTFKLLDGDGAKAGGQTVTQVLLQVLEPAVSLLSVYMVIPNPSVKMGPRVAFVETVTELVTYPYVVVL